MLRCRCLVKSRTRATQTSDVAMQSRDLPARRFAVSPYDRLLIASCCVLVYVWTQHVGLNICTPPTQICAIFSPFTPFGKQRGTQRTCNCSWRRQFERSIPRYNLIYYAIQHYHINYKLFGSVLLLFDNLLYYII